MTYRSLALITLASLSLVGASRPLNPLVIRRDNPTAVVDCASGISTAPRATPATAVAPPTGTLRHVLREAHAALERNDRPAFDAALDRAREIVRDAGQLRLWEDIARVWDAQFESPFFASGSPAHRAASAYPGYEAAVRRELLVDDTGQRFYPAAESREFLERIAASRLGGRRVPTKIRVDEDEDPARPLPRVTTRRARASTPSRRAARTPPSAAPAAAPKTAPVAVIDTPPTAIVRTATDTAATDTVATAAPPPPAPVPPAATTETAVAEQPALPPTREPKRNLLLPLVVILVGIGMLVLLFRTK